MSGRVRARLGAATVHWDSEYRTALHEALRSNPPATPTDVDITGVEVLTA